jgi:hypothetical protein
VGGCNGVVESNVVTTCFSMPPWYNDKEFSPGQVAFQPNPGPGYKGNWNHVETYLQINSITNGIGQADGVIQYWFNGSLLIDRHDVEFRAGGERRGQTVVDAGDGGVARRPADRLAAQHVAGRVFQRRRELRGAADRGGRGRGAHGHRCDRGGGVLVSGAVARTRLSTHMY